MVASFSVGDAVFEFQVRAAVPTPPFATFLATDELGKKFWISVVNRELVAAIEFEQEIKQCQGLTEPSLVVPLRLEFGDETYFLIHPDVGGERLAGLSGGRPLALYEAAKLTKRIAEALIPLHAAELIHGALEPSRILVDADGEIAIQGVGLYTAVRNHVLSGRATAEDGSTSTVCFWSPIMGHAEGRQTDIYSLGRLFLYLIAGDETSLVQWHAHNNKWEITGRAAELQRTIEKLPSAARELLECSLAISPDDRFRNCQEFIACLEQIKDPSADVVTPPWLRQEELSVAGRVAILLALPLIALASGWWGTTAQPDVFNPTDSAQRRAAEIATRPGHDSVWWPDDENVYFLIPPIRKELIRELRSDSEQTSTTSEAGDAWKLEPYAKLPDEKDLPQLTEKLRKKWEHVLDALNPTVVGYLSPQRRLELALSKLPVDERATTMHLRAVLLQKLTQLGAKPMQSSAGSGTEAVADYGQLAKQSYAAALGISADPGTRKVAFTWYEPGLKARCYADYADLLSSQGERQQAVEQLQHAQQLILNAYKLPATQKSPDRSCPDTIAGIPVELHPFLTSVLCQMASLYRSDGMWPKAEQALREAACMVSTYQPVCQEQKSDNQQALCNCPACSSKSDLQAFILERQGWYFMDRWRVGDAKQNFTQARKFREFRKTRPGRDRELFYHDWHGVAMAWRYQGQAGRAAEEYELMVKELRLCLDTGGVSDEQNSQSVAAIQSLQARLLNSWERWADCLLYGTMSWDAAVKTIQDVIGEAERQALLKETPQGTLARLYFKKALALAMMDKKLEDSNTAFLQGDLAAPRKSASSASGSEADLGPLATRQPDMRYVVLRSSAAEPVARQPPQTLPEYKDEELLFTRNVVEALIRYREAKAASAASPADARALFEVLRGEYIRLDRKNLLGRDELDLIMVGARQLPDRFDTADGSLEVVSQFRLYAELNVALARLPQREQPNQEILKYVTACYEHAQKLYCSAKEPRCDLLKNEAKQGLWKVYKLAGSVHGD